MRRGGWRRYGAVDSRLEMLGVSSHTRGGEECVENTVFGWSVEAEELALVPLEAMSAMAMASSSATTEPMTRPRPLLRRSAKPLATPSRCNHAYAFFRSASRIRVRLAPNAA